MDFFPEDFVSFMTFLVFIFTFILAYYSSRRPRGIPPGPPLVPVIGNLHSLAIGDFLQNMDSLRNKYGDIFSVYIGKELTIVLNGYSAIHDAMVKKGSIFTGRPISSHHKIIMKYPGIVWSTGGLWRERRTFAMRALQEFCFNNNGKAFENVIHNEIEYLLQRLSGMEQAFEIDNYINVSVCNVIGMVTYNTRYDLEDDVIKDFLNEISYAAKTFMKTQALCNCFPFLEKMPFDLIGAKEASRILCTTRNFTRTIIDKVYHSGTVYDHCNTFAAQYLRQIDINSQLGVKTSHTETQMLADIGDIIAAGTETTASTIRWIILYLIRNPDIQDKMFKEINAVIGNNVLCISDRKRLPYVQAVLLEGLRIAAVAPVGIPHTVSSDTKFHGYLFPENCSVLVNISSVLKDPVVWSEPDTFRPERFLNAAETEVIVPKEFIPFSLGPRACLGESIARIELFLYIATMVQKFKFLPETDDHVQEPKGHLGITWSPCPFKIRVELRS